MATTRTIEIDDFDFSGFYFPEIYRALIQFQRTNVPEITDESDEEPFQQLLRAYALTAHLSNVLLDISANECLLPTSRLLESVRGHLALIDVRLSQAAPASTDLVLEFSKVFDVVTSIVPANSQFATEETDESPQIIFENNDDFTIQPTDVPSAVYSFISGKIVVKDNTFDAGDAVNIEGVAFRFGIEWAAGASIADTVQNITDAINASSDDAISGIVAALNDGVDTISIVPVSEGITSISVTETDGATDNFDTVSASFSTNKAGLASTDAVFFSLFGTTPKAGDAIYVGHVDVMWDALEWVFDSFGSGITFAVEFYDGTLEDAKPDSVTNLGSSLEFDLTGLLGTSDRSGTVIRVALASSGSQEFVLSKFSGGVNKIETLGLLGQTTVSTDEEDYVVGTNWNEVSDTADATTGLTADGKIEYSLPQTVSQNWSKNTVNNLSAHWIRLRVISVTAPTDPSVDRILIDTGKQYLLVPVVQGQTVADDPLGSSNGAVNQQFTLTQRPLIEGTLVTEVDEGSGFSPYNLKENFLTSNNASKDYTLTIEADDTAFVTFGDGVQGKIPIPGVDNIRAIYRIGADLDGNVGANTIVVNKAGISFVNRVFNPRQALGWEPKEGSTEEDLARLKIEGPASLRVRGRGITVDDIELLATQFESPTTGSRTVSRALAIEETFGVKTIEVVVVGTSGVLLTEAQRQELEDFFNGNEELGIDPVLLANHEVTAVNYTPKIIDVTASVVGGNQAEIENAVVALLNPDATFDDGVTNRWSFGQEVPSSIIISTIFEVDPVNIKKVTLTLPAGDTVLDTRELPFAGTISITVT